MNILALPLPERPYPSRPDPVQVPIHRRLSSYLSDLPSEGEVPWTGQALPEFLRQRRSECIELLFRSLILFNDPYASMASGDSPRQPQPIGSMRNFHRFEILTSPNAPLAGIRKQKFTGESNHPVGRRLPEPAPVSPRLGRAPFLQPRPDEPIRRMNGIQRRYAGF